MTDATTVPLAAKRGGWLRKLAWLAGILLILLVVLYFVLTSGAFFKSVILPKVGQSLHAKVTVEDASISPFSQAILRKLEVRTSGTEPVVTAAEVRVRYSLRAILGGTIKVEEIVLSSPTVQIIENADGTSNLDPILKGEPKPNKETKPPTSSSKPPQIDLKKLALNDATVRLVKNYKAGGRDVTELSGLTVTLDDLKNAQTAKLSLAAQIKIDNHPPAPATNALLQAKVAGSFTFDLSADLKPTAIKGNTRLDIQNAGGAMSELAALGASLDCEVTPTDIKQVALKFQKGGANLGEIRLSGPFDMAKTEGHLKAEILSIDRQVLNLGGAASGIDFGTTTINSTNQIDLAKAGSLITAVGQFNAAKVSLTQKGQTTPTLDLQLAYHVIVNNTDQSALLQAFTLTGTQNQRPLLRADLTSPMNVAWGQATNAVGDSTLKLALTGLNLADWKPFLGEVAPAGNASLTINLLSQQAGKKLSLDLASQIDGLTAKLGSNQINQANVTLQARVEAADLKKIKLGEYRLQLAQQGQPMLTLAGSGQLETQEADVQVTLDAALARLLATLAQPDLQASAGTVNLQARVTRIKQTQTVTGKLVLLNFTGRSGEYKFENFGSALDLDLEMKEQQLQIRKAAGKVSEGANPGGDFAVTGNYDLGKNAGQFSLKLSDLNQNALRPFLAPMLGDKKLVSVSINASTSARYDPQGDSSVKADLQLDKLVVSDPKNQLPATPLGIKIQLDSSLRKQVLDLRQCQLTLAPTPRAKNELQVQGQVDMSQTNGAQGSLKLRAESLDITPYYDLFVDKPQTAAAPGSSKAPTTTAPPTVPKPETEPPAQSLPFRNFALDINIGRLYLREVDVSNWQAGVKMDGGRVVVKPFQLALNGAPVNATIDLNLGVPGYQYDVSFNADKIPVEPLANSFSPEYKGQAKGELIAKTQLKGAGMTGVGLQKNLAGQVDLSFTNANIQLAGRTAKLIITTIALGLRIPELINSPVNFLTASMKVGDGRINLNQLNLVGELFTADSQGEILLATVWENSTINNLPVNLSLKRSLAERAKLAPSDTPTNAVYVKLPTFVKVSGTIGKPKVEKNELVLAGILFRSANDIPGIEGTKAGQVLEGLGGLLPGGKTGGTNQSSTNKPAFNPFDLLKKPKK